MKNQTLGGYSSVNEFVSAKLERFLAMDCSFASLFEVMFSERENIMYERSEGYRIIKTTYGEARADVLGLSAELNRRLSDVAKGSVIGLYMDNSLLWLELFWAILRSGYRPLLMNRRLDPGSLEDALQVCDAQAVISEENSFAAYRWISSAQLETVEAAKEQEETPVFGEEVLLMSSGTSAHVKICAYGAEQFRSQIQDSYQIIRKCSQMKKFYKGELKQLTFLPFYHIFGLTAMYIWFAFFGRTFVQLNDMAPQTLLNTVRRHGVTHIFAVPLLWEKIFEQALKTMRNRADGSVDRFLSAMRKCDKLEWFPQAAWALRRLLFRKVREQIFGDSVQFMISGGSHISPDVLHFFNGIGYRLANGYGMTEIGITSVNLSSRRQELYKASVGQPFDSVEYRTNDEGELMVKSESISRYIIQDGVRQETPEWFNTKDLAEVDKDGNWVILGRRDDLVIGPNGENLNPTRIEEEICLGDAKGVCLIDAYGPTLLVSVNHYCSREKLLLMREMIREDLARINMSTQIYRIAFVTEKLLADNEFKMNRARLRQEYLDGKMHEPICYDDKTDEKAMDNLLATVREMCAIALGKEPEEIDPDADFFLDEGGTSLDYFGFVASMEEEFMLRFPIDKEGRSMSTVREFYEFLKEILEYDD